MVVKHTLNMKVKIKIWRHQGPKHKTESNMKCEIKKKILKLKQSK